ncbi:disease resistance protein RGA2-like [Miscanthus floridulus]|uniref:disease resistance protein RGA2-like n=1 Tax=Miscanthus floridulus TaxID=154761 RepID=UPI003457D3B0
MSGMEAALASGVLKVAGDKLVSLLATEFAAITGVQRDLSELQDIHAEITGWLSAARDRAIQSEPQSLWVVKLKDVAYDIDDVLQEVQLEAEKQKMERDDDKSAIAGCFCAKPKAFAFRYKMAHKIKAIKVRFAAIVKQRSDVNTLVPRDQHVGTSYRTVGKMYWLSEVPESEIPCRDQEKDAIISKLVECNAGENSMVVSIVGLGGSGKTTLAKHICHDVKIKEHFGDEIFWVHVSQEFDFEKLNGKLFQTIVGDNSDRHPPQHMAQKISEKLSNKKFLLILDDAWHEDRHDWEQFMVQLKCGAPETRIMLTTRDQKVADAVKSRHTFDLAFLSESESWNLFLKGSGWAEQDLSSDYVQVGKEIIKRCGGVPLAIRTLGAVLRDKKQISTWRAIRDNNLWNVPRINDRVFASLKLSYIHLADELKQCFTFCSIFPKGYGIQKDRLIAQWIAHGFINAMNGEQPEDIGRDYLDSLVKVRFLQEAYGSWNTDIYNMHDLIHDLTRQILKDELVTCVPIHTTEEFTHRYRYLSLTSFTENVDKGLFDKVRALYISDSKPSFDTTVKNSCCMRSVVLDYAIDTPFSLFILKFEYLGYLEIHNVSFTTVPEAISRCWNLQSLHFVNCKGFVTLPESVGKLRKLRTLELCCITDLESLPQFIGDFYVLQSLQLYACTKLREIPSSLGRIENLCVLDIERCSSLQQLPSDIIGEFKNLRTINFNGCTGLQDLPSTLSCHTLRTLNLSGTKVTMLPQWVTSIDTLECIDLEGCEELRELPKGIANLKRLAVLNIRGCSKLCCLPSGLGQLTRLRKLGLFVVGCGADDARISELENLDMIGGRLVITNLKYLKNPSDAEKACLKRKTSIQSLVLNWSLSDTEEELVSDMEHDWGVLNALEPPSQIEDLDIYGYRGPCLPGWMMKQNDSSYCEGGIMLKQTTASHFLRLTWLTLERFPNLRHMRGFVELPSLKTLVLDEMPNLEELRTTSSGFETGEKELAAQYPFPVLSSLRIRGCPKLNGSPYFPPSLEHMALDRSNVQLLSTGRFSHQLPSMHALVPRLKSLELIEVTGSSSDWELLQHLTKLKELSIYSCNDLAQLPESMRNLTSLERLCISGCPAVGTLPDWLGELHSLRRLELSMGDLKQFPEAIQHLTSLEHLNMLSGPALTVLPEWIGQLSALRSLSIQDSPALQYLPQSIQRLTALEELLINGCPSLAARYKLGAGPDWHLVSHIRSVCIFDLEG